MQTRMPPVCVPIAALLLLAIFLLLPITARAETGDQWRTVRGDRSPGTDWRSMTTTATGRMIGVGSRGQMIFSDDAGVTWTYRRVVIDGKPENITFTDIVEFGVNGSLVQRRLAAVGVWLEERGNTLSRFTGATYVFLSDDNGNTWTRQAFPVAKVTGTLFGEFEGITLDRLHVGPDQRLIAYGTTTVAENLVIVWSIGGLIYRSSDGTNWTRTSFELGPLYQMANATGVGRVVASGAQTVTDSPDGGAWNGYLMRDAAVQVGATPMDLATRRRLRIEDIIWHNGQYVAEAATYVPYDASGTIETSTTDKLYNLSSGAPFGAGRNWTGTIQPRRYGKLVSAGANLVRVGPGGVFTSGNNGANWSFVTFNPVASNNAITKHTGGNWFAIGTTGTQQNGDAVWRSTDGVTWTKVFDVGEDPDLLIPLGSFNGTMYACAAASFNIDDLWASTDNGETWTLRQADLTGCAGKLVVRGTRLLIPSRRGVNTSDDGGLTWQSRIVLPGTDSGATALALGNNGRLILGATGREVVVGGGFFYVSDDGGNTWTGKRTGIAFGDQVQDIVRTASGRLIAAVAFNPPFFPELYISDNNGETWRRDVQLQTTPGLTPIAGQNPHNGIAMQRFVVGPTGRLFLQGETEILSSDNNGDSWTVRFASYFTNGVRGGPWCGRISGLAFLDDRWVAPTTLCSTQPVPGGQFDWVLVSEDEGNTWYRKPVPTSFSRLSGMIAGENGRAVFIGSRAGVFVSDAQDTVRRPKARLFVRAGDRLDIVVPRPPIEGAVSMRFSAVEDREAAQSAVAKANIDFEPTAGLLEWAPDDDLPRIVALQAKNTGSSSADDKRLLMQLVTDAGDLTSAGAIPVTITNISRPQGAGIDFIDTDALVLRLNGPPGQFRLALTRLPTANVTVTLTNLAPTAASVSPTTLTFTPANWTVPQTVTVTPTPPSAGKDLVASAKAANPGSSYLIEVATSSTDTLYQNAAKYKVLYRFENDTVFKNGYEGVP